MNDPTPRGATLEQLAREVPGARVIGDPAVMVRDVRHDSRDVCPGDLFVARRGGRADGAQFVRDALSRGAVAVASTEPLGVEGVPVVVVDDAELALARMASLVWAHPSWAMDVIGITGTNGKTTTAYLLESALWKLGQRPGMIGTVVHRFGDHAWPALHTTPEADDLARRMASMVHEGATHVVMEVSSHALVKRRVGAVHFLAAALTNVTQDHLDFHGTLEAYAAAKRLLFEQYGPAVSVVNVDDGVGRALAAALPEVTTYSARGADASLRVVEGGATPSGIEARVRTPGGDVWLRAPLVGAHNVENLLAALGVLGATGHGWEASAAALEGSKGAPGRLERVTPSEGAAPFEVAVDYAHTPDALARVLAALRPTTAGRVVCVFGCGGDRDPGKRPRMGEAVGEGADVVVLTTDNPRSEDPAHIAAAVVPGLLDAGMVHARGARPEQGEFVVELDRRAAISLAISVAREGDVVLIAGKGHESYQEVRGVRSPFDDRDEARRALDARGAGQDARGGL